MPQQNPRRRASGMKWLPIVVVVVAIGGAALGTYALLNDGQMPWTTQAQAQAKIQEDRVGKKAYPRAMKDIPAFKPVTLEHIVDEKGEPRVMWLDPAKAEATGLLETSAVLGRVTKAPKRQGYGFTEADFLPKGSPPSRTAAIPDGMFGVSILATQVPTLRGLLPNDRFVLVAAADPYKGPLGPRNAAIAPEVQQQDAERRAFGAMTRRIVEGGVVIEAMVDAKGSSKDQAFVAVPSAQYDDLLSALNNGIEITALAESTNPTVKVEKLPDPVAPPPVERITIQNGEQKQTIVLPADTRPDSGSSR